MFEDWEIDDKKVSPPIETQRLRIDLSFKKGTLAESQPVLNFDKLVLTNTSKDAYLCARDKYGPYQQVPVKYRYSDRTIFDGYLTDPKFLLNTDEIEVKPVSNQSTDGLTEKLSAIEASLLRNDYNYQDLEFIIEKTDISAELLQLSLSSLFYFYVLYTQIKETARLVNEAIEAAGNAAGFSFGSAAALALNLVVQAIFLATTIVQLIRYAIQAKELLIPKKRTTRLITLFELCRAPLARIGYDFVTDIDDMKRIGHWASGNVNNNEFFPRSKDRCGSAIGAINFVVEKFSARVFVRDNTVFITQYYSPLFFNDNGYRLKSFPRGDYRENIDDMVGTREHLYAVDYQDKWTLLNFKGTEYKIRANISDPTKSIIKGLRQKDYGVALCNRKDDFNALERAWNSFASLVNNVVSLFGGGGQALQLSNRIGVAKISSEDLSVAKVVWFSGKRIPSNHRDELSAKSDEEKFHWIESHVRNPRAKKRIYGEDEAILQAYTEKSLSCNLNSNLVFTPEGTPGELIEVSWEKSYDNAEMIFEIEDVDRDTKLFETFTEPEK